MCELYFLIFLGVIVFSIVGLTVYINWEIFLVLFIFLIVYTFVSIFSEKKDITENAKEILVGFYKIGGNPNIKTVELYFKNNGTCDILYKNINNDYWYGTEFQKNEYNDILRKNIPYKIWKNKVYIEFDEYDKRTFIINKNFITETKKGKNIKYTKITYNESELYSISRNKRMRGVRRIDYKDGVKKKVKKEKIEYEYNEDLDDIIEEEYYSYDTINETLETPTPKKQTEVKKEELPKKEEVLKPKKETINKKGVTNTKKETKTQPKKTEIKKKTTTKKTTKVEVNNKKDTIKKDTFQERQKDAIKIYIKDLEEQNAKQKYRGSSYEIEYLDENDFRKKERGLKKYNMLAYKKLMFDFYPSFREGKFSGVVVSKKDNGTILSYELKLPTDSAFAKVYEDITLHYTVYENIKIITLNNITPEDILTEGSQKDLTTYKGIPVSKSHTEKDMFKINLLNMLDK